MDELLFFKKNRHQIRKLIGLEHDIEQPHCDAFDEEDFSEFWQHVETLEESLHIHGIELENLIEHPRETLNKAEQYGILLEDFFTSRDFALLEHCLSPCEGCIETLFDEYDKQKEIIAAGRELEDSNPINVEELKRGLPATMGMGRPMLFAAAPEERPEPAGLEGQATGLLVCTNQGEKRANVAECFAWVGKSPTKQLQLELNGCNVDKRGDIETTEAIDEYLYKKLIKIFENNYLLRALKLDHRMVVIDLTDEYIFEKADSLALAAVMAAVYAVTGYKEDLPTAYSAKLSINGRLLKVGKVPQKLETAKRHGIKRVVLPALNRKDCPENFLTDNNFQVLFFNNLSELFAEIGIAIPRQNLQKITNDQQPGFSSHPEPAPEKKHPPTTNSNDTETFCQAQESIIQRFLAFGLDKDFANRLLSLLSHLRHSQNESHPFSTVIFIGDAEEINHFLPSADLEIIREQTLEEIIQSSDNGYHSLFSLANGKELGLVVIHDGTAVSLRRVNVATADRDDIAPLLMAECHHYATLSQLCNSLVIFFPSTSEQIYLFAAGRLFARYFRGFWELDAFGSARGRWETCEPQPDDPAGYRFLR